MANSTKGHRRITFSIDAAGAASVYLVGDFNAWDSDSHPMRQVKSGRWEKTLMLAPGRYEYKFTVDGHWYCDPANRHRCPNNFGTENSILFVYPAK